MSNPVPVETEHPLPYAKDQRDLHRASGKSRYTIEKIMLALTVVFVLGIVALTITPEPFDGLAIGGVMIMCILAMYKMN